ncbi:hypothetical protein HDU91_001261 [Kappamyces sp. JEL0680]|nr:hypothetical protein HDU91_001261 [Kappamyces sp. JEL0680]
MAALRRDSKTELLAGGRTQLAPENALEDASLDLNYATYSRAAHSTVSRKRYALSRPKTYCGARWSQLEAGLFLGLSLANLVVLVVGLLAYFIFIPQTVQSMVQAALDGKGSALGDNTKIQAVTVGSFTPTGFPITISATLPPVAPLLPVQITIGALTIRLQLPSKETAGEFSTLTTTPVTLFAPAATQLTTTVNVQLSQAQQSVLAAAVAAGTIDLDTVLTSDVSIPVSLFFLPLYSAMHIRVTVQPSTILAQGTASFNAAANGRTPRAHSLANSALLSHFSASDIISVGPTGIGLNRLGVQLQDPGVGLSIQGEFDNPLPANLAPIPSVSLYLGINNTRVAQFQATNLSLSTGLQSIAPGFGVSFLDRLIDGPAAKQALAGALAGIQNGAKLEDLGISIMGPVVMPRADFLSVVSNRLSFPFPFQLLSATGSSGPSSLAQLFTNEGLKGVVDKSDFQLHLVKQQLFFRVVLPEFFPLPSSQPVALPFNTSLTLSDPLTLSPLTQVSVSQIGVGRTNGSIVASGVIQLTPASISIGSIDQVLRLGKGFLTASTVNVLVQNINLFTPTKPAFAFFSQQLPIPPRINNTLDLGKDSFARAFVLKVIGSISLV